MTLETLTETVIPMEFPTEKTKTTNGGDASGRDTLSGEKRPASSGAARVQKDLSEVLQQAEPFALKEDGPLLSSEEGSMLGREDGLLSSEDTCVSINAEFPEQPNNETLPSDDRLENVNKVYKIVQKLTGGLGGMADEGAIYGELTSGSMSKVVNLMIEFTGFCVSSHFIDIGCGWGKPNLHVAQYSGVALNVSVEVVPVHHFLGMTNLNAVLDAAKTNPSIGHKCYFIHADIITVKCLDPFTHVYMFDVGMAAGLLSKIGQLFNKSRSEFLICYHKPMLIIDEFKFDVKLLAQTSTTMSGSGEVHECYVYRRNSDKVISFPFPTITPSKKCQTAVDNCKLDLETLHQQVKKEIINFWKIGRLTRSVAASIFSLGLVLMDLQQNKNIFLPQGVVHLAVAFLLGDKASSVNILISD
ncbi:hypothetical protein ACHAW5_008040 [Stephanodiscus triporus]|uniref:DOT1 domain-containing protein n=1 Tax=Stephanodiscus triporus TaxID=2934178 RepID=A0ABD3QBA2_9STRA